jgi:hypothetical protein
MSGVDTICSVELRIRSAVKRSGWIGLRSDATSCCVEWKQTFPAEVEPLMVRGVENEALAIGAEVGELKNL